jgi:hypothetical protein
VPWSMASSTFQCLRDLFHHIHVQVGRILWCTHAGQGSHFSDVANLRYLAVQALLLCRCSNTVARRLCPHHTSTSPVVYGGILYDLRGIMTSMFLRGELVDALASTSGRNCLCSSSVQQHVLSRSRSSSRHRLRCEASHMPPMHNTAPQTLRSQAAAAAAAGVVKGARTTATPRLTPERVSRHSIMYYSALIRALGVFG